MRKRNYLLLLELHVYSLFQPFVTEFKIYFFYGGDISFQCNLFTKEEKQFEVKKIFNQRKIEKKEKKHLVWQFCLISFIFSCSLFLTLTIFDICSLLSIFIFLISFSESDLISFSFRSKILLSNPPNKLITSNIKLINCISHS